MKTEKITVKKAIEAYRIACLATSNGHGCRDGKCNLNCEEAKYFIATLKSLSNNQNRNHVKP